MQGTQLVEGEKLMLEPCVPPHELAMQQQLYGFPCPARPLAAGNYLAARLVRVVHASHLRGMFDALFTYATVGLEPNERTRLCMRVMDAVDDDGIRDLIKAKQEALQQQQLAEQKKAARG